MAVQKWLGKSFYGFLSVAHALGNAAKSFEFERFQTMLSDLGMENDEIGSLWKAIDRKCPNCENWEGGDKDLSARCGILLDSALFPHNFLLYRLVSLLYPKVLPSVFVETISSKRNVKPGRWEFAGQQKQNVLRLRFPATQKKSRNRFNRRRYYTRPYMFE